MRDNLEVALKRDGKSGIDANELYAELKFLQNFIPQEKTFGNSKVSETT
jgi:hypothetical protein